MAHKKSRDRVTFECLTQIDLKSYGELRAVPSVLSQADRALHLSWRCSAIATGRRLTVLVRILYSSRSLEDVIYRNELDAMARYEEIDNQDFKAGMRKDESERSKLNPKPKF